MNPPPSASSMQLPVPGASAGPVELRLQAEYFQGKIDTRAFRAGHPEYPVLRTNPLVLQPELGAWIYMERFGGIVFWNCPEVLVQTFLEDLRQLPGVGQPVESARDNLTVFVGAPADEVGFSSVSLRELSLEKLRLISLTLAQSVALDNFETAVSDAMDRFQPVVHTLRHRGRLTLNHREVVKLVGFAMDVRSVVLDNLTLFDDPPESWESESLAHLDAALFDQFDLEERLSAINQKLAYLQDAGATLMDLLNNRKNHGLEWIVIILILIETLVFIWKEVLPGK